MERHSVEEASTVFEGNEDVSVSAERRTTTGASMNSFGTERFFQSVFSPQ
jgi:hypothetical protein